MLLIIDYIFDWARDIYKPTIYAQLRTLTKTAIQQVNGEADTASRIADSDICSLAENITNERS